MPELPEVETIKEALRKAADGAVIESVKVFNPHLREDVPYDFEKKLCGACFTKIYRIAKYIILELDNGYSVIWHLGMSGRVKICECIPQERQKHDHIVFKTSRCGIIYNDARRFGLLTYTLTKELATHKLLQNLGLDPFAESLTPDYLLNRLKHKKTPIKIALLDQTIINGIGNIYASEALYEAGISPMRESNDITPNEADLLIKAVRKTLKKAIAAGGSTLKDYRQPDGSMGYFQHQHSVYNKTGQKCPKCVCNICETGGIKKIVQGGRSTFYCCHLQK